MKNQAPTPAPEDEQGLASGLVGSSSQLGGAIVLAIATATILAHTPADAAATQSVHAFTAGTYVSAAAALLLIAIAVAGWRGERRARATHFRAIATDTRAAQVEALNLAA